MTDEQYNGISWKLFFIFNLLLFHMIMTCGDAKADYPEDECEQPVAELHRYPTWEFTAAPGFDVDGHILVEFPVCGAGVTRTYAQAWRWVDSCLDWGWELGKPWTCESVGPEVKEYGPRSPMSDRVKYVPEPRQNLMLACGVGAVALMRRWR